jgi:hypothetical protein
MFSFKIRMKTYAARVYPPHKRSGRFIIKQTVKNSSGNFVIDGQKEAFVSLDDDKAIAEAIRDALSGKLTSRSA